MKSRAAQAAVAVMAAGAVLIGATAGPQASASARPAAGPARLWTATLNGSRIAGGAFRGTATSPDGARLFATGVGFKTGDQTNFDAAGVTAAYRAGTGALLWKEVYNPGAQSVTFLLHAVVSPDGSTVFVTGYTSATQSSATSSLTIAYNAATGARLWVQTIAKSVAGTAVVAADSSTVFVSGGADVVAYRAATGAVLWREPVATSAARVALSPDGATVFVAGGLTTTAYGAATGALLWQATYQPKLSHPSGSAGGIGVSPDGSTVYFTAFVEGRHRSDYPVVAYDAATGAERWVRNLNAADEGDLQGFGDELAVSPDGSDVFINADLADASGRLYFSTMALNATTGTTLWLRNVKSPFNGGAQTDDLAVSPDGSEVFVTGQIAWGPSSDFEDNSFVTAAYHAATGAKAWLARYRGLGNSTAFALAVSPDSSRVFVTGGTLTLASATVSKSQMATLAYGS